MIAVDANILVYAHRKDSPFHEVAFALMKQLAEGAQPWAIPWPCLHEFIAIVSHPKIYKPASSVEQALGQFELWRESPSLVLIGELGGYETVLRRILEASKVVGPKVHDARIAAICVQNGVRMLWSADRDLTRFSELRTINPLVS